MAPPLRPESGEAQLPEAGGAHMHGAARVGQKTRHGGGQTLRRRSWGSAGSSTRASCSAPRPIRGKGEALISAAPTCSCQAGSSNRSGTREAERSVRNRTISTQPAPGRCCGPVPRRERHGRGSWSSSGGGRRSRTQQKTALPGEKGGGAKAETISEPDAPGAAGDGSSRRRQRPRRAAGDRGHPQG